MAVISNSFQITFFSQLRGGKVIQLLEADPNVGSCFSKVQGLTRLDSEKPVDLKKERQYAAITLVIAEGVPIEQARTAAQQLQLRFDQRCY